MDSTFFDSTIAGFKFCWIQLMVASGVIHPMAVFAFELLLALH